MPETSAPSSVGTVTAVLAMALQALTAKVVILLAMGMTAGLFAWAMGRGSWESLAVAACFAMLVFLPVFIRSTQPHAS
jgi:hypothetical protein